MNSTILDKLDEDNLKLSKLNDMSWYDIPKSEYHIVLVGFGIFSSDDKISRNWLQGWFKSVSFEEVITKEWLDDFKHSCTKHLTN